MRDYYDRQFDREDYNDRNNSFRGSRQGGVRDSGYAYQYERNHQSRGQNHNRSWWDRAGDEVLSWFGDDYAERRRRHDGQYRGKGPKNYKRSDERIKEDINDRLTDEWNVDASDIEVTVTNGEVILTGFVTDRWQKRRAEDVAERVSGVMHVENRIRVDPYVPKENVNLIP